MDAVEPALELVTLRSIEMEGPGESPKAWLSLARRRDVPAQPSTRR